ncbi:glycosyltransferase family 4 protein [Croceicoccus bisphenolivorans]|uniref:glycosyltransferase family 4 protein n=1 Tax=Croceicoccus bisphenolivorans TaxID=1783232 RepID=UPI000836155B|nr:glycosyltransferase family 4 protein [Croceicoccus bisphenolivorans]
MRPPVAVFHPGTQHSWQTAFALQQLDRLAFLMTSLFYRPEHWPYRLERILPGRQGRALHAEFQRLAHGGLDPARVRTAGMHEWAERIASRAGFPALARQLDRAGNRRFVQYLSRDIRSAQPFHLWGFNSSSLEAFELAKRHGRTCILDRTIADWRAWNAVLPRLTDQYGDWFVELPKPMDAAKIARDDREYELADVIVCGSQHCAQSLPAHSPVPGLEAKTRVLPYCYDERLFGAQSAPSSVDRSGPVRFLFVGQVGMRKGIHHVLEAITQLPENEARLTIVGPMHIDRGVFARFADRVDYRSSVPRASIPAIMAEHHALVFPSYFEGSSLALLESLASGLALIQTHAAGNGASRDSGIVMDRPDTDLLVNAMRSVIADRDRLDAMRQAAQGEARAYSFARYRTNIEALLDDIEVD